MKKIFYIFLTILASIIFSSYTLQNKVNEGKTIVSKHSTDSLNINVTAQAKYLPINQELVKEQLQYYKTNNELNKLVGSIIVDILANSKDSTLSENKIDKSLQYLSYDKEKLIKMINLNNFIKFISNILILTFYLLIISYLSTSNIDWRLASIYLGYSLIGFFILYQKLYEILSYLFNDDYIKLQTFINLNQ